jgi:hypothetical protein
MVAQNNPDPVSANQNSAYSNTLIDRKNLHHAYTDQIKQKAQQKLLG